MNRILSELFISKELDNCIDKMVREDLRADFKQELFLILCQQDKDKIETIHSRGELKYFVVRIIINLSRQTRNVFHKQYLSNNTIPINEFQDDYDAEVVIKKEAEHEKILKHISEMDNHFGTFYYRALTELVKRHGSMNKAAKESGIPVSTISRGIKKVREHLKQYV